MSRSAQLISSNGVLVKGTFIPCTEGTHDDTIISYIKAYDIKDEDEFIENNILLYSRGEFYSMKFGSTIFDTCSENALFVLNNTTIYSPKLFKNA